MKVAAARSATAITRGRIEGAGDVAAAPRRAGAGRKVSTRWVTFFVMARGRARYYYQSRARTAQRATALRIGSMTTEGGDYRRGRAAFESEDWVEAIRSFLAAVQADPRHVPSFIGLIESYQAAAEEYGDPDLLDQASRVCRDALALEIDAEQREFLESAAARLEARLKELRDEFERP